MWRIWDPSFKKTTQYSGVDFDEEITCYLHHLSTTRSLRGDGKAIDPFGLPEKEPFQVEAAVPDAVFTMVR
jgi:hypothetical protein